MCQHCDGTTSWLRGKIIVLSSLQRTNRKQNSILHSLNIQRHHAARTRQLRGQTLERQIFMPLQSAAGWEEEPHETPAFASWPDAG
jgi:hypothetical protein